MEELISVIIPIFRVEKYIDKCVASVCRQTYRNLEILLVDDGSDDRCPGICDRLAEKDSRIRVIHKQNGGLSDARNVGIDQAKGQFLLFVDGDDYIADCMIEGLYRVMMDGKADLAICDYGMVKEDEEVVFDPVDYESLQVMNRSQAVMELFGEASLKTIVAWNKLYRRELFTHIRYPFGKSHEDEFVIHHILDQADRIGYTNSCWYGYVQRSDSIMGSDYSLKRLDGLEARKERFYFYHKKENKAAQSAYMQYLWSLYDHLWKISTYLPKEKEKKRELAQTMKKVMKAYPEYRRGLGWKKVLLYWYSAIKNGM